MQASGFETLAWGAAVSCEVVQSERGPEVARIHAVETPAVGDGPGNGEPPNGLADPAWRNTPSSGPAVLGAVKFYDPAKGFGFVVPDDGGPDVFVHCSVVLRSGLDGLLPGQRVSVRAVEAPRGLQAIEVVPI